MSLQQEYQQMLLALMPQGAAWPKEENSNLVQFMAAIAEELAFAQKRLDQIVAESNPETAYELLEEWEADAGLPTACTKLLDRTLSQRRKDLIAQLNSSGGQSKAYFEMIAKSLGYDVNIIEYKPFVSGVSHSGDPIGKSECRFKWKVQVNTNGNLQTFRAGASTSGEKLRTYSQGVLECVFHKLKPAHTDLLIQYL